MIKSMSIKNLDGVEIEFSLFGNEMLIEFWNQDGDPCTLSVAPVEVDQLISFLLDNRSSNCKQCKGSGWVDTMKGDYPFELCKCQGKA